MTIADIIDLEAQLGRDQAADPSVLEARDRALLRRPGPGVAADEDAHNPRRRGAILRRWLGALADAEPGRFRPGSTVLRAVRQVRAALVVAGLALGSGAAVAVLQHSGGHPVNVWDFLLVFVGLQLVLLALLAASFVIPLGDIGVPLVGLVRSAAAFTYPRLVERAFRGDSARLAEWRQLWHRLRSRRSLYRSVEPWLLLGLTQSFGVAFNVAALLTCLRLVTFSDVAFSWSTTVVQLDADRFQRIVQALAIPWGWTWPEAVPSGELVLATRYSHFAGAYVGSAHGSTVAFSVAGGWWPFLVAALCFYGLLPRLLVLVVAQVKVARTLATLPLDDVEVSRLVARLTSPHVETRGAGVEAAAPAWPAPPARASRTDVERRCGVLLWRDVPRDAVVEAAIAAHGPYAVAWVREAGGRDYQEGGIAWDRLVGDLDAVIVAAEAWEAPDRGALRLLRQLREALGPRRLLHVILLNRSESGLRAPSAEEVQLWREGLARLEDPYLAVEPLATPTPSPPDAPRAGGRAP